MEKQALIKSYLERFPDTPNWTLAKKIYAENSLLFNKVETVRSAIRVLRGVKGEKKRQSVKDKTHFKPPNFAKDVNPFNLPKSYAPKKKSYKFPFDYNNILVLSDLHFPYHDIPAITAALDYGVKEQVNTIFLNGDIIDCCELSRFERNPKSRRFVEEANTTVDFFKLLRGLFPDALIVWLKGNHDIRYEKYMYSKAPEIFDDPYYRLEDRLQLKNFDIKILDEEVLVYAGKLIMTHGHLLTKAIIAPVNPARGIFLRAKASVLIGHCHQVSEHTERTLKEGTISCWSTGCLCTLYQPYDPHNTKHSHGFAHVRVYKDGSYNVLNKRIISGVVV